MNTHVYNVPISDRLHSDEGLTFGEVRVSFRIFIKGGGQKQRVLNYM